MIDIKTREAVIRKNHGWQFADDALGVRRVFLDGKEIRRVIRCNQARGIVVVTVWPLRLDRWRKRVRTRRLRGDVQVEFVV